MASHDGEGQMSYVSAAPATGASWQAGLPLRMRSGPPHAHLTSCAPLCRWFGNWGPSGWALHAFQERWGTDYLLGAAIVKAFG